MCEHMMVRSGLIGLAGLALAGCAVEPAYPVRPGEPRAAQEAPRPAYPIAPPAAQPAEPLPSSPGRGLSAFDIPRTVVVREGETVFEVAGRVRTPVRAIIELNHLEPPYEIKPGDTLRIPPPMIYTVKPGDTLMSVSRRFSIDPRALAAFNDIGVDYRLKIGQKLALPAPVKDSQASLHWPAPPAEGAPSPARPPPAPPRPKPSASALAPVGSASAAGPEPLTDTAIAAAGKGRFAWPARGEVLSTFGPKGPGQRNDGVNIAVRPGEPVVAAAAGQVVYAGNSIPGFGNLVVLKHPDGWTSLYANLGAISVRIRAQVAQGQTLGVAGVSGAVDRPQVHFELRYAASPQEKARPVDPQTLLP
jgi:murein DD-endopeptidase MepM/ murein hydrolase activator NlpD